jgi:Kef-type K+ transport system membrane component KefB
VVGLEIHPREFMARRYRAFEVFLAGALALLAGACFVGAMDSGGWSRQDAMLVVFSAGALTYSAVVLRGLYLAQAT